MLIYCALSLAVGSMFTLQCLAWNNLTEGTQMNWGYPQVRTVEHILAIFDQKVKYGSWVTFNDQINGSNPLSFSLSYSIASLSGNLWSSDETQMIAEFQIRSYIQNYVEKGVVDKRTADEMNLYGYNEPGNGRIAIRRVIKDYTVNTWYTYLRQEERSAVLVNYTYYSGNTKYANVSGFTWGMNSYGDYHTWATYNIPASYLACNLL